MCGGSWTAARNVSRKNGSLDETGLEVATCRHQVGQKALNMMQGELYCYPLYLMKNFMVPNGVEYAFADVMCKLWKFVQRVDPEVASKIKPALSVMHAKGHSLKCQVSKLKLPLLHMCDNVNNSIIAEFKVKKAYF